MKPSDLGALAASFQRRLTYFPDTTSPGAVAAWVPGGRDVVLRTEDGLDLQAWLLSPQGRDRRTAVVFFPGNGGNRLGRLVFGRVLAARGFTVLLVDYRGYGGNPGTPSEEGLARDARAASSFMRHEGFPPERTLYFGESLGTGVVARLVTTDPVAGVLLRSPFTSLADVAAVHYPFLPVGALLGDRYDCGAHWRTSRVPVVVFSGGGDAIVPPRLSEQLAAQVGNLRSHTVLPGVDHNDAVWFGPVLGDAVEALADATISPTA